MHKKLGSQVRITISNCTFELVSGSAWSISNNALPDILLAFKSKFKDARIKMITGHNDGGRFVC